MTEDRRRQCRCGCSQWFYPTNGRHIYLSNSHRQAHSRIVKQAHRRTWKYLDAMYGEEGISHFSNVYWHFYNLAKVARCERYELDHNVGSRTG